MKGFKETDEVSDEPIGLISIQPLRSNKLYNVQSHVDEYLCLH